VKDVKEGDRKNFSSVTDFQATPQYKISSVTEEMRF
jgi:hypothetical protein